jgi:hypothetical protein
MGVEDDEAGEERREVERSESEFQGRAGPPRVRSRSLGPLGKAWHSLRLQWWWLTPPRLVSPSHHLQLVPLSLSLSHSSSHSYPLHSSRSDASVHRAREPTLPHTPPQPATRHERLGAAPRPSSYTNTPPTRDTNNPLPPTPLPLSPPLLAMRARPPNTPAAFALALALRFAAAQPVPASGNAVKRYTVVDEETGETREKGLSSGIIAGVVVSICLASQLPCPRMLSARTWSVAGLSASAAATVQPGMCVCPLSAVALSLVPPS